MPAGDAHKPASRKPKPVAVPITPTSAEVAKKTPEASGVSEVTLLKGAHSWRFACEVGAERELLTHLSELAGRSDVPFDWFDAALVSHQLRKRLKPGLNRIDVSTGGH